MPALNDVPGSRILRVGAHPDDELFAAPLLGALSEERTTRAETIEWFQSVPAAQQKTWVLRQ